jgi:long-chain acyl-CoA synthetase
MAILMTESVERTEASQASAESLPFSTLPGLLTYVAAEYDRPDALSFPRQGGWLTWSHAELMRTVRHLSLGLRDMGIGKGESVGVIAPSSPPWLAVDLAIQAAGGVTVPIFKRISVQSLVHEIRDSGMRHLFVGNPEEMPMVHAHASGLVHLVTFWYSGIHEEFDRIMSRGEELDQADPRAFDLMAKEVSGPDLATIIYTSGSSGLPKGVEITQTSLVSQVKDCCMRLNADSRVDVALSTLPLEHVFERMVMYSYIASGIPVFFVDDPRKVGEYMARVKPTVMTVVPRILEKVALRFLEAARAATGIKGALARGAMSRASRRPVERSTPLDAFYRAVVYRRMLAALGGRLRSVISGSARLDVEVARLLTNVGVPVHEGYGLTEAAPVISASYPGHCRLGSAGPLFPSVEVRIAEDGEILARGPNIMRGYHNNPEATAAALTPDGWLHTGDLGEMDDDGYLTIRGRKKEIFKKSTGEYVPPVPIEHALSLIPFVDTAVIVADNRTCVTALLFPDPDKTAAYRSRVGLAGMDQKEFLSSDFLRRETQAEIDRINERLHHCERVERFAILDHPADVESGELTPTLKPRRFFIEQKYSDLIEEMYRSVGGWK